MAKNLVIVESPAKAKTIEGFLGKDFLVKASFGHIRDLVKKDFGIDMHNNFEPTYEVSPDKLKIVSELKKLAKEATTVWLASDEDREGEAISWHLYETLDLKKKDTKRIVFHEITKQAILTAVDNPRQIDMNLVNAQQARRVLDRIVGFELSPVLWKKVKPSLSAGRVQSVTVRLIVDREREIADHSTSNYYRVTAIFTNKAGQSIKAELNKKFATAQEAEAFLKSSATHNFKVENLEVKPAKRTPSAPFTTSTLQQEAARKLSFSVSQTMTLAQRLYEAGKITYMRTDSVNLSQQALGNIGDYVEKTYGEKFVQIRKYKNKNASAQEAHEAIRPTYIENTSVDGERNEQRLYDLIWKRTISSQMADAQLEKTVITIDTAQAEKFVANGEVIQFEGFLKVYMEGTDDENTDEQSGMLPKVTIGELVGRKEVTATERFTYAAARFTEASLVKKLEELGIGRPSTYAPTISTVIKRNYVVKEDREGRPRNYNVFMLDATNIKKEIKTENTGAEKQKLFPTDIGAVVNDFLVKHFEKIVDFNFTAKVEQEFDEIAEGQIVWNKMIEDFYVPFHKTVDLTLENAERASGERALGIHPVSGLNVIVRVGRYGPLVQVGELNEETGEKPAFASLRGNQRLETVTLDEALELFKMPRVVGEFEGKEMKVNIGRFGPYIVHDSKFYSLRKDDDPHTVETDRAIEIIGEKRLADSLKLIREYDEDARLKVLNGRWGPYIAVDKQNFKIPKTTEAASLSFDEAMALITAQGGIKEVVAKKTAAKKVGVKKATSRKTAAKKTAAKKRAAPKKK
ncbi:MAG: type I DNA topoisomerase [Bacteroidia bacterium]|nr:type I DNA topoisomerase [Bacteroidia bacterium]